MSEAISFVVNNSFYSAAAAIGEEPWGRFVRILLHCLSSFQFLTAEAKGEEPWDSFVQNTAALYWVSYCCRQRRGAEEGLVEALTHFTSDYFNIYKSHKNLF